MDPTTLDLGVAADEDALAALAAAVEGWTDAAGVGPGAAAKLQLAVEELAQNARTHGGAGRIRIVLSREGGGLGLVVEDDGSPFDPLQREPPDTAASIEDRAVGGLGVHLVRTMFDEVAYERDGRLNRVRLRLAAA